MSCRVFPPLYFCVEFEKNWCQLFFKCFIQFTSVAISTWMFLLPESYELNLLLYVCLYFLYLLGSVLVICIFLEICSFHLGYLTCWHIHIQSTLIILFISDVHIYVPTFISDFSYMSFFPLVMLRGFQFC